MMIHNLVKYLVQTRLHLWDIKITNFVIFISHRWSRVWTRYFTRLCIIISSRCVIFFVNLDDFFTVVCTGFHEVMVCTRYVPLFNTTNRTSWNSWPCSAWYLFPLYFVFYFQLFCDTEVDHCREWNDNRQEKGEPAYGSNM